MSLSYRSFQPTLSASFLNLTPPPHTYKGHKVALFHDGVEGLAALRARADLISQQVAGREVSVAVLLHDLVTLRPLAAARAA